MPKLQLKPRPEFFVPAVAVIMMLGCPLARHAAAESQILSDHRAPAGQVCPDGSYVIGFDAGSNIICSGACGNGVVNPDESCDDGNTVSGDGCSAACQAESVETVDPVEEKIEEIPLAETAALSAIPELAVTDIEPSSVLYGTSEVTITVTGTGFNESSVIIFEGSSYEPAVNATGTQLNITLATADLSIGPYAIKVSNGPGQEITRKRAVVIY